MTLDPYALTTLARFKAWIGDTSSANDAVYEYAIQSATARIESFIGRQIMARDRIEFMDPMGAATLKLRQYPVNSCRFVGYGARTSLIVSANTQAQDLSATVQVMEGVIRTVRNRSTGQVDVTIDYDFVTGPAYSMASQVQPVIDAATGYRCSLEHNAPLRYLHKIGPIDVTDNPAYLTVPDIRASDFRIDASAGLVHLGTSFYSVHWHDYASGNFGVSPQSVCVDYNAGYSNVPYDIEEACWKVARAMYSARKKDPTVRSESLGDYSYTSAGAEAVTEILEEYLSSWGEIR